MIAPARSRRGAPGRFARAADGLVVWQVEVGRGPRELACSVVVSKRSLCGSVESAEPETRAAVRLPDFGHPFAPSSLPYSSVGAQSIFWPSFPFHAPFSWPSPSGRRWFPAHFLSFSLHFELQRAPTWKWNSLSLWRGRLGRYIVPNKQGNEKRIEWLTRLDWQFGFFCLSMVVWLTRVNEHKHLPWRRESPSALRMWISLVTISCWLFFLFLYYIQVGHVCVIFRGWVSLNDDWEAARWCRLIEG